MKQNRIKQLSLCILTVLVLSTSVPGVITTLDAVDMNEATRGIIDSNIVSEDKAYEIVEIACEIAEVSQSWELRSVKLKQDSTTKKPAWSFIWDRAEDVKKIRIDYETSQLVSYLDTSALSKGNNIDSMTMITENQALGNALRYICEHYPTLQGATTPSIRPRADGFLVEIGRNIDEYPVETDFVRVKVNPFSGDVSGFAIKWSETFVEQSVLLSSYEAVEKVLDMGFVPSTESKTPETKLEWVSTYSDPSVSKLAWSVTNDRGEFWISSSDGTWLRDGQHLIEYEGSSVNTAKLEDEPGDNMYDIMDYVYDIMHSDLTSATYENLPPVTNWTTRSKSYVFFSVGHGSKTGTSNRFEISRHNEPLDYIYATDITNVPNRYLVYLLHCYSAWSSSGDEEDCIAYQFLWNSKQTTIDEFTVYQSAVIGFDEAINVADGVSFTEAFWDALDDGDTVAQAFSDADTEKPDIGDATVILGSTSVTLT